jgi:hypothetical protein
VLLRRDQLRDYHGFGPLAVLVGVGIGFGSNFLNTIRFGDRLLLHDGYHRACAMRGLGIEYAPCIVQAATRMDELEISVKRQISTPHASRALWPIGQV